MRLGIIVSVLLAGAAAWGQNSETTAQPVPPQFEKFMIGEPPRASARVALPESSGILKHEAKMGPAARMLSERLAANGYVEQAWFVVSPDQKRLEGLAVLTRLERIDDAGKSVQVERFSLDPFTSEIASITDYFKRLLVKVPKGRYRAFAFYLTIGMSPRQTSPPTADSVNTLFTSGSRSVALFDKIQVDWPLVCTAYVYEFQRDGPDGPAEFVTNSAIDGKAHLMAASLWQTLQEP